MPVDSAERRVLGVAARQHGVITSEQLAAAGWGRHHVAHRVATGWLTRVCRGVFLVGPVRSPLGPVMAAVMSCGDGALVSHESAAQLWALPVSPSRDIHVTLPGRGGLHSRPGLRLHRIQSLHPSDASRHDGIPVTSPARTLLDLAAHLATRELARAVEEATILRLVTTRSLTEQFSRYPRHHGVAALRAATSEEPARTRSEAERRLLELIRTARLPDPRMNARVGLYEVDLLWPEARLVVEVDGYAFHSTRAAFERDRRRDAELQAAGHRVMRVTWRLIEDEPEALVASLALAYGQRMRGPA